MKNKSMNVFNIAFVDILTGALGAVIILFIIVPKMDQKSAALLDKIQEIDSLSISIDSLLLTLKDTISAESFALIQKHNDELQSFLKEVDNEIKSYEDSLTIKNKKISSQQKELADLRFMLKYEKQKNKQQQTIASKQIKQKTTRQSKQQTTPRVASNTASSTTTSTTKQPKKRGDFIFGFNPELAVILNWEDKNADVDLYMKNGKTFCDEENRSTSFGKWVKIPRKFRTTPTEMIIQKDEIVPGKYEIYAHVYRPKKGATVTITGFASINPERTENNKVDFGKMTISNTKPPYKSGGGVLIGTLVVKEKSISFINNHQLAKK